MTRFQSQVAILGWGYRAGRSHQSGDQHVSIAGGDSWVGIPGIPPLIAGCITFQSQVAILGWGYGAGLGVAAEDADVSIAGGDSWVGIRNTLDQYAIEI